MEIPGERPANGAGHREADISVVVTSWNRRERLMETLAAALGQEGPIREVLLVDNASTDGSVDAVRSRFPQVRVLQMDENRGPTVARNAGFRAARGDLVLFLDDDVAPRPDCASALARAFEEHPDALLAMPWIYHGSGGELQFSAAEAHVLGLMVTVGEDPRDGGPDDRPREIGSIITAAFMVHGRRWSFPYLFDEALFIYQEDHELGVRARLLGGLVLAVPTAAAVHRSGRSGASPARLERDTRLRLAQTIRNRWLLMTVLYRGRTLVLLAPVLLVFELLQLAVVVRKGWLGPWLSALGDVSSEAGGALRRRRSVQAARRVRDRDLFTAEGSPFTVQVSSGAVERVVLKAFLSVVRVWWGGVRRLL